MGGYDPYGGYGYPPPPPPPPPIMQPPPPPPPPPPPVVVAPSPPPPPPPAVPTGFFDVVSVTADTATSPTQIGLPAAPVIDPHLINPWGLSFLSGEPLWVSNQGNGSTTVYDGSGNLTAPGIVTVPGSATNPTGLPTGQVANTGGASDFVFSSGGHTGRAEFLFATINGTISAWATNVNVGQAINVVDQSAAHAVYTGLAIGQSAGQSFLYASNFAAGTVDMFDSHFNKVKSFTDPNIPAGYSPFNAQVVNGSLYVEYALVDPTTHRDRAGLGNGIVDQFDLAGNFVKRVVTGGMLNSPWGVEVAPANFGKFAGALLIGNFGDGHVLAYDINTGAFLGSLADAGANPIALGKLWALSQGTFAGADGNALYFTTGLADEKHGLLGKLDVSTTVQAASSSPGMTLTGTAQDDPMVGTAGNDTFMPLTGNDTIAGNGGHDVLVLAGKRGDWTLSLTDTRGHESGTLTGPGGTKLIDSIEEIRFDDARLVFDNTSLSSAMAPVAYRLYVASLNRIPDLAGLEVQAHALDTGVSPLELASNFYHSAEFQSLYGNPSDAQFVTLLYRNVLGRDPDAAGFAVQVATLAAGTTRQALLLGFSESAENVAHTRANTDHGYLLLS